MREERGGPGQQRQQGGQAMNVLMKCLETRHPRKLERDHLTVISDNHPSSSSSSCERGKRGSSKIQQTQLDHYIVTKYRTLWQHSQCPNWPRPGKFCWRPYFSCCVSVFIRLRNLSLWPKKRASFELGARLLTLNRSPCPEHSDPRYSSVSSRQDSHFGL